MKSNVFYRCHNASNMLMVSTKARICNKLSPKINTVPALPNIWQKLTNNNLQRCRINAIHTVKLSS
jgi:hypothetical protein